MAFIDSATLKCFQLRRTQRLFHVWMAFPLQHRDTHSPWPRPYCNDTLQMRGYPLIKVNQFTLNIVYHKISLFINKCLFWIFEKWYWLEHVHCDSLMQDCGMFLAKVNTSVIFCVGCYYPWKPQRRWQFSQTDVEIMTWIINDQTWYAGNYLSMPKTLLLIKAAPGALHAVQLVHCVLTNSEHENKNK